MRWRLHPRGVLLRCWQDGAAAFHQGSGDIYVLSPLCGAILQCMQSSQSWHLESLTEELPLDYEGLAQEESGRGALHQALVSMERLRLIERME
ncbi:HPr-rel-A system PqqD family peptide chaperone [Ectothiorhodospira mobilis]|uniref:HPr-rel-A system PqqD family peptide chaperone n=1 Tax=Ectothiorhodospira mobilis TaxID=195064 RepID=UPI003B75C3F7